MQYFALFHVPPNIRPKTINRTAIILFVNFLLLLILSPHQITICFSILYSNYTIKLVNNSTATLDCMRKVRTVFCPDFLAQSYINSVFTTSSACALQAFICRTHSIWFSAFSCLVTPLCSASDRTISFMRFRAASSISAQYCLTYTRLSPEGASLRFSCTPPHGLPASDRPAVPSTAPWRPPAPPPA